VALPLDLPRSDAGEMRHPGRDDELSTSASSPETGSGGRGGGSSSSVLLNNSGGGLCCAWVCRDRDRVAGGKLEVDEGVEGSQSDWTTCGVAGTVGSRPGGSRWWWW
jgi:hypothetical protein